MKKLMIVALALVGFSAAGFAQREPVKKYEPAKMQVANKPANVATHAVSKTAVYNKPAKAEVKTTATKPKTPATKVNNTAALKTNGRKRTQANKSMTAHAATTQHLKKDGTPDKRYKENKKHS
jgi:hypothetical protein